MDKYSNRLLIDVDDVMADLMPFWIKVGNEYFGTNVTVDQIKGWNVAEHSGWGSTIFNLLKIPGFYKYLTPIPGSIDVVRRFYDLGYEVIFVTAIKHGLEDRKEWIKTHLPWFPQENLIVTERKDLIPGLMMVDDRIENLETADVSIKFLVTKPWNEAYDAEGNGMIRINCLADLLENSV